MTKKLGLMAIAIAAFAMACADSTSPVRPLMGGVSLDVDTIQTNTFPAGLDWGEVRVCKTIASDDPAQQFSFTATVTPVIPAGASEAPINFTIDALPGQTVCADIYDSGPIPGTELDRVVIVENGPPTDWTLTNIDVVRYIALAYASPAGFADAEDEATRTATVYVNSDEGQVVTFTNDYTAPPSTGCTYTKGWYQNKNGSPTVLDLSTLITGLDKADAQAIFAATPGKPGNVTWGSDNLLLNLYQQLLAALNNLAGDPLGGPAAVDQAIADALAGTSVTGLAISTSLTHDEMSDLVEVLSAFNEGDYAGWPHCDD